MSNMWETIESISEKVTAINTIIAIIIGLVQSNNAMHL